MGEWVYTYLFITFLYLKIELFFNLISLAA